MKWAILLFVGIALLLVAVAAAQGRLDAALRTTGRSAVEIGPILVLAVIVMGFTEALLPQGWVERWLTDAAGFRGLLLAWLAGVLTPGGSVIGFPLAAGLARTGASPAIIVTYLTAMALLNVLRIPMEAATYGLRLTAIRVLTCAALPLLAGGLARLLTPLLR